MTEPWSGVRVVHMSEKPRRSEVVFGFTRRILGRLAGMSAEESERLPLDPERILLALSRPIADRSISPSFLRPCRSPSSVEKPELPPYFANYSLLYHGAMDREPTREELEHCAAQLRRFGGRAEVVGHHILVERDLLCLPAARMLLVTCQAFRKKKPGRRLLIRAFSSLLTSFGGRSGAASGASRTTPPAAARS